MILGVLSRVAALAFGGPRGQAPWFCRLCLRPCLHHLSAMTLQSRLVSFIAGACLHVCPVSCSQSDRSDTEGGGPCEPRCLAHSRSVVREAPTCARVCPRTCLQVSGSHTHPLPTFYQVWGVHTRQGSPESSRRGWSVRPLSITAPGLLLC